MKSFTNALAGLANMFKRGIPMHSVGSSKLSNKNRKRNSFRRMHKPLYGGMPHRMDPIGQTPALNQDEIRDLEILVNVRAWVTSQGIYVRNNKGHKYLIGNAGQTVEELVKSYLDKTHHVMLWLPENDTFRISRAHRRGIPYAVLKRSSEPSEDDLDYETWHDANYDDLYAEFYESGADGELDSDLETFIENRYEAAVRNVV